MKLYDQCQWKLGKVLTTRPNDLSLIARVHSGGGELTPKGYPLLLIYTLCHACAHMHAHA